MNLEIEIRDPRDTDMTSLLQAHLDFCTLSTPIEHVHALDVFKLVSPDITVFGAKLDGNLVAVGAVRFLEENQAELKSMHTLQEVRGKGVGRKMVEHIQDYVLDKGVTRLSLETGTSAVFEPARNLYQSMGFVPSDAFGEYENTEDNICMTKTLA